MFIIEAVILCDNCGTESSAYCTTVRQSRIQSRSEGWSCNKKGDFCPLHRPARRNGERKITAANKPSAAQG
jgi:hypothetical protein